MTHIAFNAVDVYSENVTNMCSSAASSLCLLSLGEDMVETYDTAQCMSMLFADYYRKL